MLHFSDTLRLCLCGCPLCLRYPVIHFEVVEEVETLAVQWPMAMH
jgi:hypothetical protein